MRFLPLIAIFILPLALRAQRAGTGAATTFGNCSPSITGHGNNVTVKCGDEETTRAVLQILLKLQANQVPTQTILSKLDEILATVKDLQPRGFTREEQERFIKMLQPLTGTTVTILCANEGDDACIFAASFALIFMKAGWKPDLGGIKEPPWPHPTDWNTRIRPVHDNMRVIDFKGVRISYEPSLTKLGSKSKSFDEFLAALSDAHILSSKPIVTSSDANGILAQVVVFIGERP
jgi:hypothetical protein